MMPIPTTSQNATIHFKSGIQVSGIVIEWTDKYIVLQSTNASMTVVPNQSDEILFYRFSSAAETYNKIVKKPNKNLNDLQQLADNKIELNNIELQNFTEQFKYSSLVNQPKETSYGLPTNALINPAPVQYSNQKITSNDYRSYKGLQGLFSKKYSKY